MIEVIDHIWIGDSSDEQFADLSKFNITAVLIVAHDLQPTRGYNTHSLEYAQVGLVDGPGNSECEYIVTVYILKGLLQRHKNVMVCCHTGSRSLAAVLAYLSIYNNRSWDEWISLMQERVDVKLPKLDEAHEMVCSRIDWKLISNAINKKQ